MEILLKGQRLPLSKLGITDTFQVGLSISNLAIDYTCFGLNANGQLADERYMTFFNQPQTPCGSVNCCFVDGDINGFSFQLDSLPSSIDRLVIAASVDGVGVMSKISSGYMRLIAAPQEEVARYSFAGADFSEETALIIGEFYRKDMQWRFMTVGQGFNGGLDALVCHFGGAVMEAPLDVFKSKEVNFSKVSLTKVTQSHKVSLEKTTNAPSKLIVQAVWMDNGDGIDGNDDLDLRVGILLPNGDMKLIQAPKFVGSFTDAPYVHHLGDVVSASKNEPGVEIVEINPEIAKYYGGDVGLVFSVYSALSNGRVSVASMRPKMVMKYGAQIVECNFDFRDSKTAKSESIYTYVIGLIRITQDSVIIEPSGKTSKPACESTPWLTWNKGLLDMNINGPAVFKGKGGILEKTLNIGNPRKYKN